MSTPTGPVRVALIGTRGYGASHLRTLARLEQVGTARLVGVVDVVDPPEELAGIHHRSLAALLEACGDERPEIIAIATPIDTHVPLALEALAAGIDVYLEKPPVPALVDHGTLLEAAQRAGRSVQVGFQARGGAGVDVLAAEVAAGNLGETPAGSLGEIAAAPLGEITEVAVHGAWQRDRAYYRRSPWAGRRRRDGRRVADGVATNPLAHAVHAGLAIAGIAQVQDIATVTCELRRAHDIEADDTTFLRIDPAGRAPAVVCTLTTAAGRHENPWVEIRGTRGSHRLWYTEDRSVRTGADGAREELAHERTDLMENLVAHVRDRSVALVSPLASTAPFSAVLEAIQSVPDPLPIGEDWVHWHGEDELAYPTIEGLDEAMTRALATGRPFSELGVPWAREDAVATWAPPTA
ncbi:MAG TPA: Gfo/Idh/MocA family oxidoreductase [Brachybacterium massiliense]|uniref:Gfo/Idh/MocA family oxidoreductase n=1 Tax=Brachybacterium massiliense TaxID=1755098 RepID=A0A921SXN3_9MICO|nr:Gfo/Idh/MocA family oxidoreductase [Brachybacterium massiliense]